MRRQHPNNRCIGSALVPQQERDPVAEREYQAWSEEEALQVPASSLTQAEKNQVWRHIKAHHPERVAFLNDPEIQHFIQELGAVPTFPRELVRAALKSNKANSP